MKYVHLTKYANNKNFIHSPNASREIPSKHQKAIYTDQSAFHTSKSEQANSILRTATQTMTMIWHHTHGITTTDGIATIDGISKKHAGEIQDNAD